MGNVFGKEWLDSEYLEVFVCEIGKFLLVKGGDCFFVFFIVRCWNECKSFLKWFDKIIVDWDEDFVWILG